MNISKQKKDKVYISSKSNGSSIDKGTLDILCRYIISPPSLVRLSHISNLKTFLNNINPDSYNKDPEKLQRVQFIQRGIDARLGYNLTDMQMIIAHITKGLDFTPDFVDISDVFNPASALGSDDISWVNKNVIEEGAKYGFMEVDADLFLDICTRIKSTPFSRRGNLAEEFEHLLDTAKNQFRSVTKDDSISSIEFSLRPDIYNESMTEIYNALSNPNRRLITGMQGFNNMTGGGLEATRCYCILGITGGGKSMTLLDIALQIKRYNKNYKPKDPSKTPVIVYLTQENSVIETISRAFAMATGVNTGMNSMSLQEVMSKMQNEGGLVLDDNNPIDLFITYRPNMSIDTSYLYTLYDNLHDRGYEPICFIQDHLMRIKSINQTGETRFDLGSIVNEFKTFAIDKDIPFLTNFHLNREAMKTAETYQNKVSNIDITQRMGKSNISESVQVLNNIDGAIIINKEYDSQGAQWLGFNAVKMRDKPQLTYFAQPYVYGSEIKLVEDVGGPAMFKTSVSGNAEINRIDNIRTSSANIMNNINDIAEQEPIDNSVLSNNSSMFTFSNDNNHIITDNIPDEEAPEEDELKIMKRPPITNPIIYYNEPEPQQQVLNLNSLSELSNLLLNNSTNNPMITNPIITNPNEFIWDDISKNIYTVA